MNLTDQQLERYSRHIILKEVGGAGQAKLLDARVLVVGAGGLGSPLLMYLAAAGVGTLGIVDDDVVSLSNLQRQIIHATDSIGDHKTDSAAERLATVNPDVVIVRHQTRMDHKNAHEIISSYDVIADGCDNFETRFLVNDACYFAKKPLVSAALGQFEGQLATFRAFDPAGDKPCYRCIFPEPPPPGTVPSCAEGGILGAIAGVMGTLQGVEVLKEILGIGSDLAGHLMIYDALSTDFRKISVRPDPACALCGGEPTIVDLSRHAA